MKKFQKVTFLFPGQGAQYVGMGKDFFQNYAIARETYQEAEDLLKHNLTKTIFEGPESELTKTLNSQLGIYVTSMALLRVLKQAFPEIQPAFCAGLSLGEYSALTASGRLDFSAALSLVQHRAQFMNEACEAYPGTMAVVMGLEGSEVEELVASLKLPQDLWAANFNCPGQVVISGTSKGIEIGTEAAKARGAKRVLPLQVYGAFHSGLMQSAQDKLAEYIMRAPFKEGACRLVMNVPGDFTSDMGQIVQYLIKQVTHPVRWEQSVRQLQGAGTDLYIEIGCGKTLSGLNKRIGVVAPTLNIEKVEDLAAFEQAWR